MKSIWNIIYEDTDSIFVLLPQRSKVEAFKIASEKVKLITDTFPIQLN